MSKKTINFITLFFYISLIIGFILGEDLNGGAKSDFIFYENIISNFSNNFKDSFLNYEKFNERHSPIMIIFLSLLTKINFDIELIRLINLHINLLTIYFFFKCLNLKFYQVNKNYLYLISLVVFVSPNFRSLSIWPDSRLVGFLFFIISVFYFLKSEKNSGLLYVYLNIFFLAIASYFSLNYSVFAIYFFYKFFLRFKFSANLYFIIFCNLVLALPAIYYIFILKIFFMFSASTPGLDSSNISFLQFFVLF